MRTLEPLVPEQIEFATPSAFRDLLTSFPLAPRNILDVGAGGFLGQTTTRYLLELYPDARLVALEIDVERARALAEKLAGEDRVEVVTGSFEDYSGEQFDLIVLDIDTPRIPRIFSTLLPGKVLELLAPGGAVISVTITDANVSFSGGPRSLPPANRDKIGGELEKIFGTPTFDDATYKSFYSTDPNYRAIVHVEKFRDVDDCPVGWLLLQRRD